MLLLDFSRPTILDFSKLPTYATENTSNFEIFAASEPWFTTLNTRLTQFFNERRTGFNWLHQQGIYDLFLLTLGDYRLSVHIETLTMPTVFKSGIYVYIFKSHSRFAIERFG